MTVGQRRILFARSVDAINFNAQAKNVQNILRRWRSSEVRPAVISFFAPDQGVAANPNVDILRIASDRLWRAKLFVTYMKNFDAVFCPGLHHYADWAALKARALLGRSLPIIATVEGLLGVEGDTALEQQYSKSADHPVFSQRISRAQWRRADELRRMAAHVIAISPFLARQVIAQYGPKVSTLSLGVDTALFRRANWERRARPRIVCAGNVQAHKQPQVFLTLATRFPDADFVWFGDGELRAPLRERAIAAGIANLAFPGMVPPEVLAREFAASDIMVLPSRSEGVPKVTQEAAAAGLAQIVFGFYEAPSVVNGVNGCVVWGEDEMAECLGTLLDNPDLVERFGRAGTRMAEAWSWDIIAPQWEDCIIDLLTRESRSSVQT